MNGQTPDNQALSIANVFRTFSYWPRLFRILWQTHPLSLLLIALCTVTNGFLPVGALLAQQELINLVLVSQEQGLAVLIGAFVLFIGTIFAAQLVSLLNGYVAGLFEIRVVNHVNVQVMEKAISLSLADFENAQVQDQLKRAQADAGRRIYQVAQRALGIISGMVTLVSAATVLIFWKWWVALVVMAIPLLSFLSFLRLGQEEFQIHWKRAERQRKSWYLSHLLTRDNSFKEIKLYRLGGYLLEQYRDLFEQFYQEDKRLVKKRNLFQILFQLINLLIIGSMMIVVLWAATLREISIGQVVGLIQAIRLTESASQGVVQGILALCQNNLYVEQMFMFLDMNTTDERKQTRMHYEGEALISEIPQLESVEFRQVSFRYPGTERYALRNVSFKIQRGETLAVVGRNGAGKSTLAKLLARLYEGYEGEILLNGLPLMSYDREALMQKIGIVFQDFVQYEMPLRQNIGFGDIEHLHEESQLWQAAKQAGIDGLVERMPEQFDTQLGRLFENGEQLSGGQWQRVAIARAFMRDAGLYVLDEPSSFLDPHAESDVFEKFRRLVENRIGIYISHRYSSVSFSDQILVMDQGTIVEHGTHWELMKQNGMYAELYQMQMESFLVEEEDTEQASVS